jgi:hypothetical protein
MGSRTIVGFAARTATGNSGALPAPGRAEVAVGVSVTVQSGTAPTLTFDVQWSDDGVNFFDSQPVDNYTQITTTVPTRAVKKFTVKGAYYRLRWTIAGTTPSYSFAAYEHR